MSEAPVPSPCIRVCVVDAQGRYCTGCYRTLEEIAQWGALSNEQRRAVVEALEGRRRALGAKR